MPNLNITEFAGLSYASGQGGLPIVPLPPLATQNIALTATSAQSSAFNTSTRLIRVNTDTACFIEVGSNPTALATSLSLGVGREQFFAVPSGAKIAART